MEQNESPRRANIRERVRSAIRAPIGTPVELDIADEDALAAMEITIEEACEDSRRRRNTLRSLFPPAADPVPEAACG